MSGSIEQFQITRLGLDELIAQSDIVSLHVPLTEATRGMVNRRFPGTDAARQLADQHGPRRPGGRGRSPRQPGLRALAGAGLDVLNHEPPEPGNPLLGLPNVVFSPHIAGTDLQSMSDMAELAAHTIVELYHNRWPAACVVNGEIEKAGDGEPGGPAAASSRSTIAASSFEPVRPGTTSRSRSS